MSDDVGERPVLRRAGIPVPPGGFASNEEEAAWLRDTIVLRSNEALAASGINARLPGEQLFELLLVSINQTARRAAKAAAASPVEYPVRTLLDVSVDHLSPTTRRWIDEQLALDSEFSALAAGATPHGWFLWVPAADTRPLYGTVPEDLAAVFAEARARRCEFVLFDADAASDVIDGLPVFDEDEETDQPTGPAGP